MSNVHRNGNTRTNANQQTPYTHSNTIMPSTPAITQTRQLSQTARTSLIRSTYRLTRAIASYLYQHMYESARTRSIQRVMNCSLTGLHVCAHACTPAATFSTYTHCTNLLYRAHASLPYTWMHLCCWQKVEHRRLQAHS